jgi:hypothetical protein
VSYQNMADALTRIAERLRAHDTDLQGVKLAKAAERLRGSLGRFEGTLETELRGVDPEAIALKSLLDSPDARKRLDARSLRLLGKKATGKAVTLKRTDAPREQRRRLLESAIKLGKVREVTQTVRAFLLDARRPAPDLENRDAVLEALWRLGKLSETDLEIEKLRLLENEALLRSMAGFAYVKTTPRSTPRAILTKLVKFSQRVRENVS